MKLIVAVVAGVLLGMGSVTHACSYPPRPTFAEEIPHASSVFVFQVVSAAIQNGSPSDRIVATIRIVETLKGSPSYKQVTFSNRWCGGNRLDVGHFFVAAASQPGPRLDLRVADLTVLDITQVYREHDRAATSRAGAIPAIRSAVAGKSLPKGFPAPSLVEQTQTFMMPPPPPPPPKSPKPCSAGPNNSFKPMPLRGSA